MDYKLDWIKVQLTRCCNLKCSFCSQADFRDGQTVDTKKFIENVLAVAKPRLLIFTGGEPITRIQELEELLTYCKENNIETGIFSNATLIDENCAKKLKNLNVDWVRVSINGYNATIHELSYPEGAFDLTIKGIKELQKAGIYVKTRTTVTKNNKDYIKELIEFIISLGIKELDFRPYLELGDCNPHKDNALSTEEMIKACSELIKYKKRYEDKIKIKLLPNWFDFLYTDLIDEDKKYEVEVCNCGRKYLYIDSAGNYRACAGHKLILDNINEHPVDVVWNSCQFLAQTREYKQDPYCQKCPKKIQCHRSNCHLINYEVNGAFEKINPCCPLYNQDPTDIEKAITILETKFKKSWNENK